MPWISRIVCHYLKPYLMVGVLLYSTLSLRCAAADVTLYYYDRPPFMQTNANGPSGYFIERTERVLKKAGVSFTWELMPVNRIFADLKSSPNPVCSSGWYSTPDRRAYALFSKAIYRDLPLVGLARSDSNLPENAVASILFQQATLTLLVKDSVVYGAYLDDLIAKMPAKNVLRTTSDFANSVKMIHANRADFTLVAQEEFDTFIKNAELSRSDFKIIHFSDEPAVEFRYILCSHAVPVETITRINKAIDQLGLP